MSGVTSAYLLLSPTRPGTTLVPASADEPTPTARQAAQADNGTVLGVYDHLFHLEEIAQANGDNRASGLPGYRASRNYVVRTLRSAGYEPEVQAFPFPFFQQTGPSTFEVDGVERVEDEDYSVMTYSGAGDVTGTITGVDLQLTTPNTSDSGCSTDATTGEPEDDFADFPEGDIALLQRGTCAFGEKVANAEAAGAVAAIVMNQGNTADADRQDLFSGTLGAPVGIPAISVSYPDGETLASGSPEGHIVTQTVSEERTTWNVTAETKGDRQNVVMAGAHLDSVPEGHGINDNGSGSAALLETAEKMADRKQAPDNRVRFAWWGAEELGLLGSEHYVADLAENHPKKFQNIALYLNFDMVGSPNYMLGVYDGDGSLDPTTDDDAGPAGSDAIERSFVRFFDELGTGSVPTEFSGRSDYGPFIALNVPAGGLFTGAEGLKSEEEAEMFGGTAGEPYDACYHAACDGIDNLSYDALKANTAAILHAVKRYAGSTRSVNGDSTGHQPPPPAAARTAGGVQAHDHGVAAR